MEGPRWEAAVRQAGPHAVSIQVHVEPGSSRAGVGPFDPWRQRIQVRVSAPAKAGKANREVARLLAEVLDVPTSDVVIHTGSTSRRKTVKVHGLTIETALERLDLVLGQQGVAVN